MKRIHVVGLSPRSGTTLMMELIAHCFDIQAYAKHEMSILRSPQTSVDTFVSKKPHEFKIANRISKKNSDIWVVLMIRDPRDIIVSKHDIDPDVYFTPLTQLQKSYSTFIKDTHSKRLITVKYEELVKNPDAIQHQLEQNISFLSATCQFSDFQGNSSICQKSLQAMGGARKIETSSIGNWKDHLPRVKSQIDCHGSIDKMLMHLGYEENTQWHELLHGIISDNSYSHIPRNPYLNLKSLRKKIRFYQDMIRYFLRMPKCKEIIIKSSD